jgi:hypothetical protein
MPREYLHSKAALRPQQDITESERLPGKVAEEVKHAF